MAVSLTVYEIFSVTK